MQRLTLTSPADTAPLPDGPDAVPGTGRMPHAVTRRPVHCPRTGERFTIPVIDTPRGPLPPLVTYCLAYFDVRNTGWLVSSVQAVRLLLDYLAAHPPDDEDPALFTTFAQWLATGTVAADGSDPRGLYWPRSTPDRARRVVTYATAVCDWLAHDPRAAPLVPGRAATREEELLAMAVSWRQRHPVSLKPLGRAPRTDEDVPLAYRTGVLPHIVTRRPARCPRTGAIINIPTLLSAHGPLQSLVDYCLMQFSLRRHDWWSKSTLAVRLLLDYLTAHQAGDEDPKALCAAFAQRLTVGTVGADGSDPSGLFWSPRQPQSAGELVRLAADFCGWLGRDLYQPPAIPWRAATRAEELLAWAAWYQRKSSVFHSRPFPVPVPVSPPPVASFPEERLHDLLLRGFVVPGCERNPWLTERLNLRDVLITLLLHYGGLRLAEPFHLYAQDVIQDPWRPGHAQVLLHHPHLGPAPADWQDAAGQPRRGYRATYLQDRYGLRPRPDYGIGNTLYASWADHALEPDDHGFAVVWFPTWAGALFWQLWVFYQAQRAQRACAHPFAFVSRDGSPYSTGAFHFQRRTALARIGLKAPAGPCFIPGAHRKAYKRALALAGVGPGDMQYALHHRRPPTGAIDGVLPWRPLAAAAESAVALAHRPSPDWAAYGLVAVAGLGADLPR